MPVTTNTTYGSNLYENLILRHTPTAAFGPFASATNTISDLTNRNLLTASLVTGASFSSQIPIFALASELYTFDINSSGKIVIKENSSYAKAIGSGKFASGDEQSDFCVEFLLSKNYDTQSNADFARFGFEGNQHAVGISYSNRANEFYLNIYSINGYIRYRSVVFAGPSKLSKHLVINFIKGRPTMYVNGIKSNVLVDNLTNSTFFASKVANRIVAEFSCATNNEHLLLSMPTFYNYALPERIIKSHYEALFDIGDFKSYIASLGSPLLYERIPFAQKIARNDGMSQDFFGTNVFNTDANIVLRPATSPNFYPYGLNSSYMNKVFYSGAAGVASTGGFSFKSDDFKDYLVSDGLAISFSGIGTGKYTKENVLFSVENTSVGDIYVAIDSASSKIHIGTNSGSILAYMSSSIAQTASSTIFISSNNSVFTVAYSDASDSASYDFNLPIIYDQSIAYLFNRYYSSSIDGITIPGGNSEINFEYASAGLDGDMKVYLSNSFLNTSSNVVWGYQQKMDAAANISIPIPERSQNYLYLNDSSDAIAYTLFIDSASSVVSNESIIDIPTTSSYVNLYASITGYWNSNVYNAPNEIYIKNLALYNFTNASFTAGGYPAKIEITRGLINNQNDYLNIFKQKNIGFIQTASNTVKISKQSTSFDDIGQIDFLISIPDSLSTSSQCLIYTDQNLITNSNFESNITGWFSDGASVSVAKVTSDYYSGSSCMEITKGGYPDLWRNITAYDSISPASGTVYNFSAYIKVPAGNENISIQPGMFFYSSSTYVGGTGGSFYDISSASGWVRVTASAIVPAGTTISYVSFGWSSSTNTTGQKFLVDSVLLQKTNVLNQYIQGSASMYLIYNSPSNTYLLNFAGMTASVNGQSAVSGSTRISPRQHYFIQSTLTNYIPNTSSFSVFSKPDGSDQYQHSFDRLSIFPFSASNAINRYAQIFGRKTINVSDNHQNYLRVESLPDDYLLLNKTWQIYSQ